MPSQDSQVHFHVSIFETLTEVDIIIRTIRVSDGPALARLSRRTPVSPNAPPLTLASFQFLIEGQLQEDIIPLVIENNKVTSSPRGIRLVILARCPHGIHGGDRVIGTCGFSMIDNDSVYGGKPVRSGYLKLSLDAIYEYREDIIHSAMKYLMALAFRPAAEGGLQLDCVRIASTMDDTALTRVIGHWKSLLSQEVDGSGTPQHSGEQMSYWEVNEQGWQDIMSRTT